MPGCWQYTLRSASQRCVGEVDEHRDREQGNECSPVYPRLDDFQSPHSAVSDFPIGCKGRRCRRHRVDGFATLTYPIISAGSPGRGSGGIAAVSHRKLTTLLTTFRLIPARRVHTEAGAVLCAIAAKVEQSGRPPQHQPPMRAPYGSDSRTCPRRSCAGRRVTVGTNWGPHVMRDGERSACL